MPLKRKQRRKLAAPRSGARSKKHRLVPDIDISAIISPADPYDITRLLRVEDKHNVTVSSMVDKLGKKLREKRLSFAPQVDDKENTPSITGKPPTGKQQQQRHGLREIVNWSKIIQSQDKPTQFLKRKLPNTPHPRGKLSSLASSRPASTVTPDTRPRRIHTADSQRHVPSSILRQANPETFSRKAISSRKLSIAPSCNLDLVSMELTCQTVATNKDLVGSSMVQQHHHQQQTQEEDVVEEMVIDDMVGLQVEEDTEHTEQEMEVDDNRQCAKDKAWTDSSSLTGLGLSPILMHSGGAVVQHSRGPLTSSPFVATAVRGKQGTANSSNSLGSLEEHFGALNMTPILPVTPLASSISPLSVSHTTNHKPPLLSSSQLPSNSSARHVSKDCTVSQPATKSKQPIHSHSTESGTDTTLATAKLTPTQTTTNTRVPHNNTDTTNTPTDNCGSIPHVKTSNKTDIRPRTTREIVKSPAIARQSLARLPSRKLTQPSSTTTANRKASTANCRVTNTPSKNDITNRASYRRSLTSSQAAKSSDTSLQIAKTSKTINPARIVKRERTQRKLNLIRHAQPLPKRRKLKTPKMTPANKTTKKSSFITNCRAASKSDTDNTLVAMRTSSVTDVRSNNTTLTGSVVSHANHSTDNYSLCLLTMWDIGQGLFQIRRPHTGNRNKRHTNHSFDFGEVPMDILLTL